MNACTQVENLLPKVSNIALKPRHRSLVLKVNNKVNGDDGAIVCTDNRNHDKPIKWAVL